MGEEKGVVSQMTGHECTESDLGSLWDVQFAVERDAPWLRSFNVYVRGRNYHLSRDDWFLVTDVVLRKYEPEGMRIADPSLKISPESAQQLMDELWRAGVRPNEDYEPTSGVVESIGRHLDDMRRIAFMFLERKEEG